MNPKRQAMTEQIRLAASATPLAYDSAAPTALVITGTRERGTASARLLEALGVHVRAEMDFAAAAIAIGDLGPLDLILIEGEGAPDALFDSVLARADMVSRARGLPVVASVAIEQLDAAAAHLMGTRVQLLCAPDETDRTIAISFACAQAGDRNRLHGSDVTREGEAARLQRLNEEVARIADTLVRLSRGEDIDRPGVREGGNGYRGADDADMPEATAPELRAVIRSRRLRAQYFEASLFADPAWDMLLDLYASELERRRVSVSSLCIAAAVPPTTALRWITTMHEAGLFAREADPTDRRRAYVVLSDAGRDGMRAYIAAVKRQGLNLV